MFDDLRLRVGNLFENNRRTGFAGKFKYDYTCSSPGNYPHQWLWDSCFHSIVLTHLDLDRAKSELKTLLFKQRSDGFIPCVTIWKNRHPFEKLLYVTKITQPPAIPIAAEIIYKKSKDLKFLVEVYPKLKKFMDWFPENRDSNKNGLIEAIHPWETGIDSTPTFDSQLGLSENHPSFAKFIIKYFWILFLYSLNGWNNKKILKKKIFLTENVLMNSIYIKALKSMLNLAKLLNKKSDYKDFQVKYNKALSSLIKYCWSSEDKIFYDLDADMNKVKVKTISSLMPLIIDSLPQNYYSYLVGHLTNKKEFWSTYPVTSVAMDEHSFSPHGGYVLWRGPSWVNTNWFLSSALLKHGYKIEAYAIADKTIEMVTKNGFWEFYNPLTGQGYGQPNLGWSALVLDMSESKTR